MRNVFRGQFNLAPRLGITAGPRRAIADGKASKPSYFNSAAGSQGIGHMVDDGLDRRLNIAGCKLRVFKTEDLYQV